MDIPLLPIFHEDKTVSIVDDNYNKLIPQIGINSPKTWTFVPGRSNFICGAEKQDSEFILIQLYCNSIYFIRFSQMNSIRNNYGLWRKASIWFPAPDFKQSTIQLDILFFNCTKCSDLNSIKWQMIIDALLCAENMFRKKNPNISTDFVL